MPFAAGLRLEELAGLRAARGLLAADVFFLAAGFAELEAFLDPPARAVEAFFDDAEAAPDVRFDPPDDVRLEPPDVVRFAPPPDVVRLALPDDLLAPARAVDEVFFEPDFALPEVFRDAELFAPVVDFFAVDRPPDEVFLPDDFAPEDLAAEVFFADEVFEDADRDEDEVFLAPVAFFALDDFFAPADFFAAELLEPVDFFFADFDLDDEPFEAVLLDDELFEVVFFLVAIIFLPCSEKSTKRV